MTEPTVPRLTLAKSLSEFEAAKALVPGGVLGIRRPYNFVEGEYPVYFAEGKGGHVVDVDGNDYIDYLCAYGPIILGYREEEVDNAVIAQIRDKGFCFSLTQPCMNRLAETLSRLIPCAEMSVVVKTGSDATTLAVRLARSYTGRNKVFRSGYHGWHDWCVEVKGGVPQAVTDDVHEFAYNDLAALEALFAEHGTRAAAVIITPYGHPLASEMLDPEPGFLEAVKELAHRHGAVLIFDEIRTGFRFSLGGAQKLYGVTPDLATFGKAMANGYAIAAVVGIRDIMKEAEKKVFVSSTFFPNADGIAAALKTIEILERDNVLDAVWKKGGYLMEKICLSIARHDAGAVLSGVPPMFFITFRKDAQKIYKEKRTAFYTHLIRRGVFLQPFHHGYVCFRHTQQDLDYTAAAIDDALRHIAETYS